MRGREYGDDITRKVPGEIDAQRARRILEELRKRFGESMRPQLELDYIERLLKDFETRTQLSALPFTSPIGSGDP